jgi:hypothetical protein
VVVRCENTELDPRVDREVCRALDLRSAVVVPVIADGYSVAGLLEVFSSRPHAFSGRHVLLLRQIAELISGVVSTKKKRWGRMPRLPRLRRQLQLPKRTASQSHHRGLRATSAASKIYLSIATAKTVTCRCLRR